MDTWQGFIIFYVMGMIAMTIFNYFTFEKVLVDVFKDRGYSEQLDKTILNILLFITVFLWPLQVVNLLWSWISVSF